MARIVSKGLATIPDSCSTISRVALTTDTGARQLKGEHLKAPRYAKALVAFLSATERWFPHWAKQALDDWISATGITKGRIFRAVARGGKIWGSCISENVVWYVVRNCCQRAGLEHIAPRDLRRTCAKLCHTNGGELEQIQFLLGHASVLTTERYLGCKQNLGHPVNDLFDLKMNVYPQETSPGSSTAQAMAGEAPSSEEVGCRQDNGSHDFQRPAPQAVGEKEAPTVRRDESELSAAESRFLAKWDGAT
jgi:hypothetical protein